MQGLAAASSARLGAFDFQCLIHGIVLVARVHVGHEAQQRHVVQHGRGGAHVGAHLTCNLVQCLQNVIDVGLAYARIELQAVVIGNLQSVPNNGEVQRHSDNAPGSAVRRGGHSQRDAIATIVNCHTAFERRDAEGRWRDDEAEAAIGPAPAAVPARGRQC
eukprot:356317-Chlamydomonas_euryale.AAC.4